LTINNQLPTTNILISLVWRRLLAFIGLAVITGLLVILTNVHSFAISLSSPSTPPLREALRVLYPRERLTAYEKPGFARLRGFAIVTGSPASAVDGSPGIKEPLRCGSSKSCSTWRHLASKTATPSPLPRLHTPHTPPTSLPLPQPHPLPYTLAQWQDTTNSGDYFSQVAPTPVGYLVWSQFPIKVYIETPQTIDPKQAQAWVNNVLQAVHEWNAYLPLQVVENQKVADITVIRKNPPLQKLPNSNIPRARSAQTTYEFYNNNNILYHRFIILLSPSQTGQYLLAAARHELGHALGIWGHSQLQSDSLYFSQIRNPPPISARDVNTLKRVYEQPTSLGWTLRSFRTSPKSVLKSFEPRYRFRSLR
jgi:predicted Zn-dependent protease